VILRRQLPVHSPISLDAVLAGVTHGLRLRGDPRERLRELLRRRYGQSQVILCGSGTEALQIALRMARGLVGEPTAVALPAFTCFDVGAAAVADGAPITLYDLDPSTLNPDFESLEARLSEGARIVVIAALYGLPVDWDAVERCVAPYGAVAIEDAAQGHGSTWRGKPVGSLGKLSVLSFGRGKGWTGIRGGAVLLHGGLEPPASSAEMRHSSELAVLLAAVAQWTLGRPALYALPASIPWLRLGEAYYRKARPPASMVSAAAAILERTLAVSANEAQARRRNAEMMLVGISPSAHVRPVPPLAWATASFLRLPIRLSRGLGGFSDSRRALRLGVAPGYPLTLADLAPVQAQLVGTSDHWLGARELTHQLVTLPTHSLLTAKERAEVLHLVNSYPGGRDIGGA
jgi:dTDP-4-amino-4,6-dideoxygalactose transaminase